MTNVIAHQQYFHQTVVPAAVAQAHSAQPPARYVVGYCFNPIKTEVVLIDKLRPAYLLSKLNGVGGRVEAGESPLAAMCREFCEDAGVVIEDWYHFHTERFSPEAEHVRGHLQGAVVYHFVTIATNWREWDNIHTMEAEYVVKVNYPLRAPTIDRIIYNLAYRVPMAATLLAQPVENRPVVL